VAYAFRMESASTGGWLGVRVVRTGTVAVGGEIGFFTGATDDWSIQTDDPVFGRVMLTERREQGFWFVRCVVRYRLPPLGPVASYAVLGTGLYGLHELLSVSERTPEGVPVRAGSRSLRSHSYQPGVGAGFGVSWQISREGWLLLGDLSLHSILGVDGLLYPVLMGSVGAAKRI